MDPFTSYASDITSASINEVADILIQDLVHKGMAVIASVTLLPITTLMILG